jgi:hypothetical protein
MLFSERLIEIPKYLNIEDSSAPAVANAQHDSIFPWFLTEVTQPQSRKSNLEGSAATSIVLFNNTICAPGMSTIVS